MSEEGERKIEEESGFTLLEEELLIDFVRNHEELYNMKAPGYKNTQLKKNCGWKLEIN